MRRTLLPMHLLLAASGKLRLCLHEIQSLTRGGPTAYLRPSHLAFTTRQEDDMSRTAGTVLRASRLRTELAG